MSTPTIRALGKYRFHIRNEWPPASVSYPSQGVIPPTPISSTHRTLHRREPRWRRYMRVYPWYAGDFIRPVEECEEVKISGPVPPITDLAHELPGTKGSHKSRDYTPLPLIIDVIHNKARLWSGDTVV